MSYTFKDYGNREVWENARNPFSPDGLQGIGTSEVANACGHGYGTPLELWETKTGLREPFRGNEASERGRRNEPSIRAWFAMNFKQFRINYSEFGVYISDELPLFTTLDGELEAVEDCDFPVLHGVTGQQCFLHLKKGMKGILEIKDTEPQTEDGYIRWNAVPVPYQYQVAGQNICRGGVFTILVSHITGPYAHGLDPIFPGEIGECRIYGFDMPADLASIQADIRSQLPSFWESIREKRNPGMSLYDSESESLVTFNPRVKVGEILADFEEAKEGVIRYASRFDGLVFSDDQLSDAKKARAELNGYIDSIKKMRISVKKEWMGPLDLYYKLSDQLIEVVEKVRDPISAQITEAEDKRKAEKKERCDGFWKIKLDAIKAEDAATYQALSMIGLKDDPAWLNASVSIKKVGVAMDAQIAKVRDDLSTIKTLCSGDADMHSALMQEYLAAGDINAAIRAKDRILAARKVAEKDEVQVKGMAEAVLERMKHFQKVTEEAWKKKEPATEQEKKEIAITIRFTHTDMEAFRGLLGYMKDHGFAYELVE